MFILFLLISLAAFVVLIAGLIKPSIIKSGLSRKKVVLIFGIGTIAAFILAIATNPASEKAKEKQETQAPIATSIPKPKEVSEPGKEAFLRLPDNTDPKQLIPLAPTKEVSGKVTKTLLAKDWQGLLELASEGVFGLSNGSKVLVIDTALGLRKVRIIAGVREVDKDKVGLAGWVAKEFVVDK